MRIRASFRKRRCRRAADAVSAVKTGYSGTLAEAPPRTNRHLYSDENPIGSPSFEEKAKLLQDIDAHLRNADPRVRQVTASLAASWQHVEIVRGDGQIVRDIRPLVRLQRIGRRRRRRPAGERLVWRRRPQGLWRVCRRGQLETCRRRGAAPGAGEFAGGSGAGRHVRHRAFLGMAGRDAARGGRAWARRRLQPQEDVRLRRADGPAGSGEGRDRGRRRHDLRAARLADHRRRGHADQPQRADRGRQAGRLHAGPAERAADGRQADRQRAARGLCTPADAAHDQHLHDIGRHGPVRRSSPRSRTASTPCPSAAGRSTSRQANSCSAAPRPT